ncbi:MAG: hypothetical protein JNL87_13805 [Burkholderiaceae bacterium]|nr:hypothetical protein [Burkholderiaceae bacterium]
MTALDANTYEPGIERCRTRGNQLRRRVPRHMELPRYTEKDWSAHLSSTLLARFFAITPVRHSKVAALRNAGARVNTLGLNGHGARSSEVATPGWTDELARRSPRPSAAAPIVP